MEIYQSNRITKDELMRFFDDLKSNFISPFIISHNNLLRALYERSLLKDDIDTIEFENTEFQEYLAAKEIVRMGNTEQIIFDLAIVPELKDMHPS